MSIFNKFALVLALIAPSAFAQSITPQIGGGIGKGFDGGISPKKVAAASPLLLDSLTVAPSVAYSTRKLRVAYAGFALRVRRSSDSTSQDIGFLANGQLDTVSMATFVGANSGFVTIWYDQSTNANNAASSSGVPRIVNAGTNDTLNGHPSIRFGPVANAGMTFTVALAQPTTIALVGSLNSFVANGFYTDGVLGTPRQLVGFTAAGAAYESYAGTAVISGGIPNASAHDVIGIFNGASSLVRVDGTTVASGNPGTNGMGSQVIGGSNGGGGVTTNMDGWLPEYIAFPLSLGTTDQATLRASWQTQWGTP